MADDIDDLLDECETKFFDSGKKSKQEPTTKLNSSLSSETGKTSRYKDRKPKSSHIKNADRDELHDMIQECMDDGPEIPELREQPAKSLYNSNTTDLSSAQKRCVKVFLGGSKFAKGLCTGSEERVCDKLRCTSCDFNVVILNDYEWHKDCDYLFFRNNIPDFDKLISKLTRKRGCCAYACQCTWKSVVKLTELWSGDPQLKWVCGKHS